MSTSAFKLIDNKIGYENSVGRVIDYEDTGSVCGQAMLQKSPNADFEYVDVSLEDILNTIDDSEHGYLAAYDMEFTDECKERPWNNTSCCCYWCNLKYRNASIYKKKCDEIYDHFNQYLNLRSKSAVFFIFCPLRLYRSFHEPRLRPGN